MGGRSEPTRAFFITSEKDGGGAEVNGGQTCACVGARAQTRPRRRPITAGTVKNIFAQNAIARQTVVLPAGPIGVTQNRGTGFRTRPTSNGDEIINGCRQR